MAAAGKADPGVRPPASSRLTQFGARRALWSQESWTRASLRAALIAQAPPGDLRKDCFRYASADANRPRALRLVPELVAYAPITSLSFFASSSCR